MHSKTVQSDTSRPIPTHKYDRRKSNNSTCSKKHKCRLATDLTEVGALGQQPREVDIDVIDMLNVILVFFSVTKYIRLVGWHKTLIALFKIFTFVDTSELKTNVVFFWHTYH